MLMLTQLSRNQLKQKVFKSKYLIGYLDKDIRPSVLIMLKISGYVTTYKVEAKINKSTSFLIDDEKC